MRLRPAFALLPLFLLLIVAIVESRKDLGEYWKLVMKDQDMPENIQGLVNTNTKNNFNTLKQSFDVKETKNVVKDFEPRPNLSAYGDNDTDAKENMGANEEFEPRLNVSAYGNNEIGAEFKEDFEPRPSLMMYSYKIDGNNEIGDEFKE